MWIFLPAFDTESGGCYLSSSFFTSAGLQICWCSNQVPCHFPQFRVWKRHAFVFFWIWTPQDDFFPRVSTKSMKRLFICTFALWVCIHQDSQDAAPYLMIPLYTKQSSLLYNCCLLSMYIYVHGLIFSWVKRAEMNVFKAGNGYAVLCRTGVVVFILWVKQAFQITHSDDPRRLYPPGKICHFVYKKPGRPGHHPIRARIVPSSQGRFERLVLSSSGTTKNHFVLSLCEHLKVRSSVLLSHGYVLECRVQHFAFCHQYPTREKFTYMRSECVIIVKRQMVVNDQHL